MYVCVVNQDRYTQLCQWKEQATKELEDARQQLAEIQKHIRDSEQRLELVNNLLALERPKESVVLESKPLMSSDELLDACEKLVRETGRPMHIRELHAALLNRGVPLPGRGEEANLIVRLQRSGGRFVRVGRGTYAPAELGFTEVKPSRTRRRARRSGEP